MVTGQIDTCITSIELGDLREKFQENVVAKVFLVKLSKARTVTLEQLVAMFSPLNFLQFESLPNCVLFAKLEL